MSNYSDDIKRIAREKENPAGLGGAKSRPSIPGSTKDMANLEKDDDSEGMTAPLTLNILTYDDDADVEIEDTSAVTHTLKTAATAEIVDADGKIYPIETITFAAP